MEYLKEKFSVPCMSKEYRENWEIVFFNPFKHCSHAKKCILINGHLCSAECELRNKVSLQEEHYKD